MVGAYRADAWRKVAKSILNWEKRVKRKLGRPLLNCRTHVNNGIKGRGLVPGDGRIDFHGCWRRQTHRGQVGEEETESIGYMHNIYPL